MKIKGLFFAIFFGLIMFGYCAEEAQAGFFVDVLHSINKAVIKVINKIAGHPVGKPPNTHFTCQNGQCVLVDGAGSDQCISSDTCIGTTNTCTEGTPFGSCVSGIAPKYCYGSIAGGELIDKCKVCGCPSGETCGLDEKCTAGGAGNDTNTDFEENVTLPVPPPDELPLDSGIECVNGNIQPCGINVGECREGTITCAGGKWGICQGGVGAVAEICNDGKDNDCDGNADNGCNDGNAGGVNDDSDGDGLLDSWEMQYLGTLDYGPNDDPDSDGVKNVEEFTKGTNPTTSDKQKVNVILIAGSVVGAMVLILVISMIVKKIKNKKPKINTSAISQEKEAQMHEYIRKARERGFTDAQIKDSLVRVGWNASVVESYFSPSSVT